MLRKGRQVRLLAMWVGETRCICSFPVEKQGGVKERERKKRAMFWIRKEGRKGGGGGERERKRRGVGYGKNIQKRPK